MQTNIDTATNVTRWLKSEASRLADLPNTVKMVDARALAFADVSTAMELCAVYLADFLRTNDKDAARKFLPLVTRVSEALTILSEHNERRSVGMALVSAQQCLIKAHVEFRAHVDSLLTASRATVCA